jgi:chaperonin GroES
VLILPPLLALNLESAKLKQTLVFGESTMSTLNLRPLGDRVVVQSVEEEDQTFAGGKLVLPETAKEKPQKGKILAAGAGRKDDSGKLIAMDVKVDDVVLYAKYAGTEIKIDGKKLLILKESDILAIIG